MSGWWTERVVPRLVDASLGAPPISDERQRTCAGLHGAVLEIGFGSGLNLPHLPTDVTRLDAVEPSALAWARSAQRRAEAAAPVRRIGLDGQRVEAPAGDYDAALCTFTLCTVPEPERALAEIVRLLRPGGRLHLLEHGAGPTERTRRWQRRLDPLQRRVAGGCHLTRDPVTLVTASGLRIDVLERRQLGRGPARPWTYLTRLTATRG